MADVVGRRLKRLRLAQGLSLRALASRAGVSASAINAVEVGTRAGWNLTAQTCVRLATALGVPIGALLSMDDDDAPAPGGLALALGHVIEARAGLMSKKEEDL
jgi:transcriptional regulator with XRE-family HTH domain